MFVRDGKCTSEEVSDIKNKLVEDAFTSNSIIFNSELTKRSTGWRNPPVTAPTSETAAPLVIDSAPVSQVYSPAPVSRPLSPVSPLSDSDSDITPKASISSLSKTTPSTGTNPSTLSLPENFNPYKDCKPASESETNNQPTTLTPSPSIPEDSSPSTSENSSPHSPLDFDDSKNAYKLAKENLIIAEETLKKFPNDPQIEEQARKYRDVIHLHEEYYDKLGFKFDCVVNQGNLEVNIIRKAPSDNPENCVVNQGIFAYLFSYFKRVRDNKKTEVIYTKTMQIYSPARNITLKSDEISESDHRDLDLLRVMNRYEMVEKVSYKELLYFEQLFYLLDEELPREFSGALYYYEIRQSKIAKPE